MNEKHMSSTQLKLINTAGPLFAEDGLKGTRIRSITEAAGVNVAGINYHFGSKEKLYLAVVQFVFDRIGCINIGSYWNDLPVEKRNKENIYKMLEESITEMFTKFFKSNHPTWYFKIIQKELSSPTVTIDTIDNEFYFEDITAISEMFSILKPNVRKWEVDAWLAMWYSQIISLSIMFPRKIKIYGNNNMLDEEYIDMVTENTIIAVTSTLEPRDSIDTK